MVGKTLLGIDLRRSLPRSVYPRIPPRMTGRSMGQLGFRAAAAPFTAPAPMVPRPREESVMERRDFLLDAGALLGLPFAADKALGRIGSPQVRAVNRAVTKLYAEDHEHGSVMLKQEASRALHTAYQWLQNGTYSTSTERKLRTAVGALSIAAGWLSFDSGRPGDAHALYGEALAAARISGDPELEAHAFGWPRHRAGPAKRSPPHRAHRPSPATSAPHGC